LLTEIVTWESTATVSLMERANIYGLTEQFILANLKKDSNMGRAGGGVTDKQSQIVMRATTQTIIRKVMANMYGHQVISTRVSTGTMKGMALARCSGLMAAHIKASGCREFSTATAG